MTLDNNQLATILLKIFITNLKYISNNEKFTPEEPKQR